MARELLLSAIENVLAELVHDRKEGRSQNLTNLVFEMLGKNTEFTIKLSKGEFCERMEKCKWVKVGVRGEAIVTPEGEAVLEKIEVGEDLENILSEWDGCFDK